MSYDFNYEEYTTKLIELMMKFPHSYESVKDVYMRGQNFKKFIREHLKSNPLKEGEKIAVVTHSKFI